MSTAVTPLCPVPDRDADAFRGGTVPGVDDADQVDKVSCPRCPIVVQRNRPPAEIIGLYAARAENIRCRGNAERSEGANRATEEAWWRCGRLLLTIADIISRMVR